MKTKIIAITLCGAIAFAQAGCGGSTKESEDMAVEEAVPLTPEDYLDSAQTYYFSVSTEAFNVADAGKDLYTLYMDSSATAGEILETAEERYEEKAEKSFDEFLDGVTEITAGLEILKEIPDNDETCSDWYDNVIIPITTIFRDLYTIVFINCDDYLSGGLNAAGAFLIDFDAALEELDDTVYAINTTYIKEYQDSMMSSLRQEE